MKVLLLTFPKYIDNGEFAEEMIFCKSLETITTTIDIYRKLKNFLNVNSIPRENIISCAADGVLLIMRGEQNGRLKLMKDENPEVLPVHCYS